MIRKNKQIAQDFINVWWAPYTPSQNPVSKTLLYDILPPMPRSSKSSPLFRFSKQNYVHISDMLHILHMLSPSHPQFNHLCSVRSANYDTPHYAISISLLSLPYLKHPILKNPQYLFFP